MPRTPRLNLERFQSKVWLGMPSLERLFDMPGKPEALIRKGFVLTTCRIGLGAHSRGEHRIKARELLPFGAHIGQEGECRSSTWGLLGRGR